MGMNRTLYFCLSNLESGEGNLPINVGRHIELPFIFRVLALVRSYTGIKLHFGYYCFSNDHKRKKKLIDTFTYLPTLFYDPH